MRIGFFNPYSTSPLDKFIGVRDVAISDGIEALETHIFHNLRRLSNAAHHHGQILPRKMLIAPTVEVDDPNALTFPVLIQIDTPETQWGAVRRDERAAKRAARETFRFFGRAKIMEVPGLDLDKPWRATR